MKIFLNDPKISKMPKKIEKMTIFRNMPPNEICTQNTIFGAFRRVLRKNGVSKLEIPDVVSRIFYENRHF